jgi:HupE / UreJ protein
MSDIELYLKLGLQHITDTEACDHIIFVAALCAAYTLQDWRRVLLLITAFTIGHSLTLALSVLQIILIPSALIEILIPLTIMITCILNINGLNKISTFAQRKYWLALFFGFIHGCGFSNYLKTLLGSEESIWQQLLCFNIGLEFGQLIIVCLVFALMVLFTKMFHVEHRKWVKAVSSLVFCVALYFFIHNIWITFYQN